MAWKVKKSETFDDCDDDVTLLVQSKDTNRESGITSKTLLV